MEIGSKIKQLRCRASLTQEQLADKLGLSAQAVSKWENSATMPDISLLPELAQIFGTSIDELFDLTTEQKIRRIENRMDIQDDLEEDVFREYESFLKEQISDSDTKQRITSVLAYLYHHRMESYARKAAYYAREAIQMEPEKKDCQWILQKAEGSAAWDWNIANHSRTIEFYKKLISESGERFASPRPYYYLIDNLIADHRTKEARYYLKYLEEYPEFRPYKAKVYEAAIELAEYNEAKADEIMEKAMADHPDEPGLMYEAAQYYARKCDYEKAIQYYEASFAAEENKKPRYTDALDGIADIYMIMGDYGKAAETKKRILDLLKNEWGFTEETIIHKTETEIQQLKKAAHVSIA